MTMTSTSPGARRAVATFLALAAVVSPVVRAADDIFVHGSPCGELFDLTSHGGGDPRIVPIPSAPTALGDMTELNLASAIEAASSSDATDADATATLLLPLSLSNRLLTLSRIAPPGSPAAAGRYAPVGRSYGANPWERSAGPEAEASRSAVLYGTCCRDVSHFGTDGTYCPVTVPLRVPPAPFTVPSSSEERLHFTYHLTSYGRDALTARNRAARFLERSTFGPRTSDLDAWEVSTTDEDLAMAQFVRDQTDSSVTPVSSHREYYRRRLNPRSMEVYKYGLPGPRACEPESRWRRFAFTDKDRHMSSVEDSTEQNSAVTWYPRRFTVDTSTVTNGADTKYLLSFAGELRTMIDSPLVAREYNDATNTWTENGLSLVMDGGSYNLCLADEMLGSHRGEQEGVTLPPTFGLVVNDVCRYIVGGNPTVNIDPRFVGMSSLFLLDFSEIPLNSATGLEIINEAKTGDSNLLLRVPYDDSTSDVCSSLPDPYDNDYRGFDSGEGGRHLPHIKAADVGNDPYAGLTCSKFDPDAPVFAKLADGTYALHDYRLVFHDNTISEPLLDGGASYVLEAHRGKQSGGRTDDLYRDRLQYALGDNQLAYCANVEMNPFNEEGCKLSYEPNVCESLMDDTNVTVTLTDAVLAGLNDLATGERAALKMDGLVFTRSVMETGLSSTANRPPFPCEKGRTSRWLKVPLTECSSTTANPPSASQVNASCPASSDGCDFDPPSIDASTTLEAFRHALLQTSDDNPLVKDVIFFGTCHTDDEDKYGMVVEVVDDRLYDNENGENSTVTECYRNVHPDLLSVYDIKDWAANSSSLFSLRDPDNATATFVDPDTMSAWEDGKLDPSKASYLGRAGDSVPLHILPAAFRDSAPVREGLGMTSLSSIRSESSNRKGGVLVCGSHGEVAPDPTLDDYFFATNRWGDTDYYALEQRQTIWTKLALGAPDQLRQRMAWALSQIFAMNPTAKSDWKNTETNIAYYDILVRNALGNYRDLLKEISFNPKMGDMLTYRGSTSSGRYWYHRRELRYPDENYSREIMQLYTIGLLKLNLDGTPQLDERGDVIPTYNTVDVASLARIWTGFYAGSRRGNYEDLDWATTSYMDPMKIVINDHDFFPKRGLDGTYIGDRYPLCVDQPEHHFLRRGARYRLLGRSSHPKLVGDKASWHEDESESAPRLVLDSQNSTLHDVICDPDDDGACTFPVTLTLTENLQCHGHECEIDTIRSVQVAPGVFYEYVRLPCVQLSFYEGAKKVMAGNQGLDMCANPKMPVAVAGCIGVSSVDTWPFQPCRYVGERTTHETATARCPNYTGQVRGQTRTATVGDPSRWGTPSSVYRASEDTDNGGDGVPDWEWLAPFHKCQDNYRADKAFPAESQYMWTDKSCSLKVVVNRIGLAAIVHDPVKYEGWGTKLTAPHVRIEEPGERPCSPGEAGCVNPSLSTIDYFSVHWGRNAAGEELFPSREDNECGGGACKVTDDGRCLCDVAVVESAVFAGMPSRANVLARLSVGAFEVDMFDNGEYVSIGGAQTEGVEAYRPSGSQDFGTDTIFKVTDEYRKIVHLKNMESTVKFGVDGDDGGVFQIRNPPNFMDTVDPEVRDAYYEVDAVLDHYVYHPNTAPFVAKQLIQRFGTSNPSPRYVEAVATAFRRGLYTWSDGTETIEIGDEKWGSLSATVAAVLLDRDATSPLLDADPSQGSLREPLLKVIGTMRSMEYEETVQNRMLFPMLRSGTAVTLGQMAHESPDQFSFFSPDYTPSGVFSDVGLVAPESQIVTMRTTSGITNGLIALFKYGLNDRNAGLGTTPLTWSNGPHGRGAWHQQWAWNSQTDLPIGSYDKSVGFLGFSSNANNAAVADDVIDELATLLTSGRLSDGNKAIISAAYGTAYVQDGEETALRVAQQLITAAPEFHTTDVVRKTDEPREVSAPAERNAEPYKAIVHLHLSGGMDSFYLLAPWKDCDDLYAEYAAKRGPLAALPGNKMLEIDATQSDATQPCDSLGLNSKFSFLKTIYDRGEGIFLANTGHLSKPVSRYNYFTETRTQLFSHHTMTKEALFVDAFREKTSTGVLGRMLDVLEADGYSVGAVGIDKPSNILDGDPITTRQVDVIGQTGPDQFASHAFTYMTGRSMAEMRNDAEEMRSTMESLNGGVHPNSGLYADHWSQSFVNVANKTDTIRAAMADTTLASGDWQGGLQAQLQTISKLIGSRDARGVNRDAFHVTMGGFDSHTEMMGNQDRRFGTLNNAISLFYNDLVAMSMLNNVTFVMTSEFGRTITANAGGGTDHAWGGNYFVFGGEIKGGKVLGQYPEQFDKDGLNNDGRGRLIPTTSWDAVWNGVAQWFGVTEEKDLAYTLPNRNNMACRLFSDQDMYTTGRHVNEGCDGETLVMETSLILAEAKYLSTDEQKFFCEALLQYLNRELGSNSTMRCVITDQHIFEITSGRRRRLANNETAGENSTAQFGLSFNYSISTPADLVGQAQQVAQVTSANTVNAVSDVAAADAASPGGDSSSSAFSTENVQSVEPAVVQSVESTVTVDECTATPDICGDNAACTNTVLSYTCACDAGFTGTPPNCAPPNDELVVEEYTVEGEVRLTAPEGFVVPTEGSDALKALVDDINEWLRSILGPTFKAVRVNGVAVETEATTRRLTGTTNVTAGIVGYINGTGVADVQGQIVAALAANTTSTTFDANGTALSLAGSVSVASVTLTTDCTQQRPNFYLDHAGPIVATLNGEGPEITVPLERGKNCPGLRITTEVRVYGIRKTASGGLECDYNHRDYDQGTVPATVVTGWVDSGSIQTASGGDQEGLNVLVDIFKANLTSSDMIWKGTETAGNFSFCVSTSLVLDTSSDGSGSAPLRVTYRDAILFGSIDLENNGFTLGGSGIEVVTDTVDSDATDEDFEAPVEAYQCRGEATFTETNTPTASVEQNGLISLCLSPLSDVVDVDTFDLSVYVDGVEEDLQRVVDGEAAHDSMVYVYDTVYEDRDVDDTTASSRRSLATKSVSVQKVDIQVLAGQSGKSLVINGTVTNKFRDSRRRARRVTRVHIEYNGEKADEEKDGGGGVQQWLRSLQSAADGGIEQSFAAGVSGFNLEIPVSVISFDGDLDPTGNDEGEDGAAGGGEQPKPKPGNSSAAASCSPSSWGALLRIVVRAVAAIVAGAMLV